MLIPFGVFSAAGAGGGAAAGAYELISTTTVLSATTSIDFTSIIGTYKHLQIRYVSAQGSNAGYQSDLNVRFNGVTTSSYAQHYLYGTGGAVNSSGGSSNNRINMYLANGPYTSGTPTQFAAGIIDILDYASTSKNKTLRALAGHDYFGSSSPSSTIGLYSGFLNSTSAITSISIYTATNDIGVGSRFSLYGIKG